MEPEKLCERLTQLTKDIPAIASVRVDPKIADGSVVVLEVPDIRPNQEDESWRIIAMYNNAWPSEILNSDYPCFEFLAPLGKIDPTSDGYIGNVAGYCLPWVDHQRLFPGPSFRWDPDTGNISVYAQVWDDGQPPEALDKALNRSLLHLIGLVYHATWKKWEMGVRESLGKMGIPIVQEVYDRMNGLLRASNPKSEDDSID